MLVCTPSAAGVKRERTFEPPKQADFHTNTCSWPKRVDARSYCFARPRPYPCNRMREESILIVEDNEDFRGLVRIALEQEGFTVREARDGREALDMLQESGSSHCLMLMDLMMPGMTCWELVSAVRGDPFLRNNPIIVTTVAPEDAPSGI